MFCSALSEILLLEAIRAHVIGRVRRTVCRVTRRVKSANCVLKCRLLFCGTFGEQESPLLTWISLALVVEGCVELTTMGVPGTRMIVVTYVVATCSRRSSRTP